MESFSELHNICIKVFESVAGTTAVFILPLFLGKVVFSNVMGEGAKAFTALKGALLYFILVAAFPLIVELLFSIPEAYLPKFNSMASIGESSPGWDISSIPFSVDRVLEVILAGLYWVVYYLHVFFMLLMCSMAPIVFLLSALLGVGLGLEIFMGLLIVGSSWPIIWYGFDQVHANLVNAQSDAFGAKCLELLITLFKGLAPVTFASLAVKSPAGRAIGQATTGVVSAAKWTGGAVLNRASRGSSVVGSTRSFFTERNRKFQTDQNIKRKWSGDHHSDRMTKARIQYERKGLTKNENT